MGKKGKRLREFEKKNREFSVRESGKRVRTSSARNDGVVEFESRKKNSPENEKKTKKTVINVKRFAISAVILIFVVSVGFSSVKLLKLKGEKDSLTEKQESLDQIREELTAELEYIDSEEYIEQQARKNLRLIKKNEILFILSEDDKTRPTNDGKDEQDKAGKIEEAEKPESPDNDEETGGDASVSGKKEGTRDGQAEN